MRYSDKYIIAFRDTVSRLDLRGKDLIFSLTIDQIRAAINGIGSEGMHSTLRKALDRLHPSLVYPSHIHDCQWQYSMEKSVEDFKSTNADFEHNGELMVYDLYKWYNPLRYVALYKARQFRGILDTFGWSAYLQAKGVRF